MEINSEKLYCRICLVEEQNFKHSLLENNTINILIECLSVQIDTENDLSTLICNNCFDAICIIQKLKENILKSEKILKQKPIKLEIDFNYEALDFNGGGNSFNESIVSNDYENKKSRKHRGAKTSDLNLENKCSDCNDKFSTKNAFRKHLNSKKHLEHSVNGINEQNLIINEYNNSSLTNNIDKINEPRQETIENDNILNFEEEREKPLCIQCNRIFKSLAHLRRHFRTSRHLQNSKNPENFKEESPSLSDNELDDEKGTTFTYEKLPEFHCIECNHTYFYEHKFSVHMKKHADGKPIKKIVLKYKKKVRNKCKYCDRVIREKDELLKHMYHHKGISMNIKKICYVCGTRVSHLRSHLRDVHDITDRSKHICRICKERQKFVTKDDLMNHLKSIHNTIVNKERVICPHCGDSVCKVRLSRHIQNVHLNLRPHQCSICKKQFSSIYHMKQHLLTHTDDRPYQCETCFKKFRSKKSLIIHQTVHTGERFKCDLCEKSFTQKGCIMEHKKKAHPEMVSNKNNNVKKKMILI